MPDPVRLGFPLPRMVRLGLAICLLVATVPVLAGLPPVKTEGGYTSPEHVEGATTIGVERAHGLWEKGVAFVDPRSQTDFLVGHIPGAVHIINDPGSEPQNLSAQTLAEAVAKDEPVVFYCNGPECDRSSHATAKAVKWGWSDVHYFRDGFPAWQDAGFEVATSDKWPDETRGIEYYRTHPKKARWISNQCDTMSIPAMTGIQKKHCTQAKIGLLRYLGGDKGRD